VRRAGRRHALAWADRDHREKGRTGWLVEPNDEVALADTLVEVVNDPRERDRRGREARLASLSNIRGRPSRRSSRPCSKRSPAARQGTIAVNACR
jgi:hypothetical protein